LAHARSEEVGKPRFESRPGVEYELREDGIQSWRLFELQASEGSSKLLRSKGFRTEMITEPEWTPARVCILGWRRTRSRCNKIDYREVTVCRNDLYTVRLVTGFDDDV